MRLSGLYVQAECVALTLGGNYSPLLLMTAKEENKAPKDKFAATTKPDNCLLFQ